MGLSGLLDSRAHARNCCSFLTGHLLSREVEGSPELASLGLGHCFLLKTWTRASILLIAVFPLSSRTTDLKSGIVSWSPGPLLPS